MCSARSERGHDGRSPGRRASFALALFSAALSAGCALQGVAIDAGAPRELTETPFFPQERYQCGPAALLTVLTQSGVRTDMETLVQQVYLPARRGSLQAELTAATRRAGRIPWRLAPGGEALVAELDAGRPVLVLQNLGVGWWPRWHYAVVVGVGGDRVILRSGTERRRVMRSRTFLATWRRSGFWAFVALRPDELPAQRDRDRWFRTLSELEEAGQYALAAEAWERALAVWPGSAVALFGLANSQYGLGDWAAAEASYRRLLAARPGLAAALNNRALALMRLGRLDEAESEAERALAAAAGEPDVEHAVRETLAQIRAAREESQSRSGRPSSTSR